MKRLFLLCALIAVVLVPEVAQSATTWYLPEGSTQTSPGGNQFVTWILVNNPNSSSANIKVTFYKADGTTVEITDTLLATSRWTYRVNDNANMQNTAFSTKVECTNGLNIYAERAQYWPTDGPWLGGTTARGISGLEGCYTEISQPSSFPITISSSGSYKLISNLTCSTQDVNAITITASNVTLDLNGFTITGPGETSGSSGDGIYVTAATIIYNIFIKDGTIRSFRGSGIHMVTVYNTNLSNLILYDNGEWGCYQDGSCFTGIIKDCLFYDNGNGEDGDNSGGLYIQEGVLVERNVFRTNHGYGIYVYNDENFLINNIVSNTQEAGIASEAGIYVAATATKNRIDGNHCMNNNTNDIDDAGSTNSYIYNTVDQAIANAAVDDFTMDDQGLNETL